MRINELKNPGTRVILRLLQKEGRSSLKKVQNALNNLGNNIYVDGDIGPITINAIKRVPNKLLHIELENILLNKNISKSTSIPLWLVYAKRELGTKEIPGSRSNPRVLQYHAVSGGFTSDAVPWCASFVNFIMLKSDYKGPRYPARAKSWLNFGTSSHKPVLGSIAVKSRKGGGHVGFVVGQDSSGKYVFILGGNQNDEVNIRKYKKSSFMDFRVPYGYTETKLPIYNGISDIGTGEA